MKYDIFKKMYLINNTTLIMILLITYITFDLSNQSIY